MLKENFKKKKIMVITQCFPCGSWLCIEKILEKFVDYNTEIFILGLGKIFHKNEKFSYFSIPYPRYDRWGFVTTWNPIISFLWNLPLFIIGIVLIIIYQPKIVISNGLTTGLSISPFVKLLRKRSVIMFHSHVGSISIVLKKFLKGLGRIIDLAVVNSKGSFQNLTLIISPNKIVINEHYVDDFFFSAPLKTDLKRAFTILYVGRIDKDKICFPLIETAQKLKDNKDFLFLFVGVGEHVNFIKNLEKTSVNIKYLGYINNRIKLRQLYRDSDIVWSFADETYLGLPAVESLACGTPIIIPKIPALGSKKEYNEIGKDVVPSQIGWIINPYNKNEILKIIINIKNKGIDYKTRKHCREYARLKYSSDNLDKTIGKIRELIKNN